MDAETIQSADVQIRAKDTGNVDTQWLTIYQGHLVSILDEIVDLFETGADIFLLSRIKTVLFGYQFRKQPKPNVTMSQITDGELVDEVFDGEIRLSQVDG